MQSAVEHHRAGRLHDAEVLYRQALAADPADANVWHLLGMVAHAAGHFDDAAELVGHACTLQPSVWAYRHNLAEAHRAAGRHDRAAAEYEAALRLDAAQPRTHVGLGAVLDALGRRAEAAEHYRRAAERDPASAAAHYGLAVSMAADGQPDAAAGHARRAVELAPDDADARVQLGSLLSRLGDDAGAVEHFRAAAAHRPAVNYHVGVALARQGLLAEAVDCFARAVAAEPDFGDAYTLAGRALTELGRRDEGIDCFRRAAELMPDRADAWHDLAWAMEGAGRPADAADAYDRAGRLGMADEARLHLAALGRGAAPAAPPPAYVRRLFDDYADRFDRSLVDTLQYRTPGLIVDAIRAADAWEPPGRRDVIDLGCGTGLLGELLRPTAGRLVGVDLSPRMVDKARERGLYDELVVGDVVEALAARPAAFDLVAAADVFVYLGDLGPVFRAAAAALRPGGLFAFSVEFLDDASGPAGYRLGPSRRYAHSPAYVRRVAGESGLIEVGTARAGLRLEKGQEVEGLVVVLRKPGADV